MHNAILSMDILTKTSVRLTLCQHFVYMDGVDCEVNLRAGGVYSRRGLNQCCFNVGLTSKSLAQH